MNTLTYDQARDLIQDGDIIFIANKKGFFSSVVRWATKSRFSHCNIAFWVDVQGVKRLLVVEAQGGTKRRIINLSYYVDYMDASLYVVTPPRPWPSVTSLALAKVGDIQYNYVEAIYVGLRDFLWHSLRIKIPARSFTGEICSEFIANVFGLPIQDPSPEDIYNALMQTQELRFIVSP